MSNSQNVSPGQFAANRANAAKSTGPRSPEGKARSSQNARKHGFAAAAYTVVSLEDSQQVANLKDDAVDFYQPVDAQELFAVERIVLTQQALLRVARLEAGLFSTCLNQGVIPDPDVAAADLGQEQRRNLLLAEGFERSAANSSALSLCVRYSAHAERQYRRAVAEFERLKALRPEIRNEPNSAPQPQPTARARSGETNPIPPEAPQSERFVSIFDNLPEAPISNPAAEPRLVSHRWRSSRNATTGLPWF
jgi:hypothetical protein